MGISTAGASVPAGTIVSHAGPSAPAGFLACPTAQTNISRTAYAALFLAIGTQWGAGDGVTTFGMPWYPPDYADSQASGNVGSSTAGSILSHVHHQQGMSPSNAIVPVSGSTSGVGGGVWYPGAQSSSVTAAAAPDLNTGSAGGSSNYAAGIRVLKCVKY